MQRFQFVAVDGAGSVKRGHMSAATRAEAVASIEKRGLQVREVTVAEVKKPDPASGPSSSTPARSGEAVRLPEELPARQPEWSSITGSG